MVQLFVIGFHFGQLLFQVFSAFFQLPDPVLVLHGGQFLFQHPEFCFVLPLDLVEVQHDPAFHILVPAVDVHKGFEAVFLPAVKEPVDGPLLISFAVIFVKVFQEIVPQLLFGSCSLCPQSIGKEFQVNLEVFPAKGLFQPGADKGRQVVVKIFLVRNRQNVVIVWNESLVFAGIPLAPGISQSRSIQGIPAEQAANSIGQEGFHDVFFGQHIIAAGHGFRHVLLPVEHPVDSDILIRHFRSQFVLESVQIDKDPVQLLLFVLEHDEPILTGCLEIQIPVFQGGLSTFSQQAARQIGYTFFKQGMKLEVPRSFEGVPVGF